MYVFMPEAEIVSGGFCNVQRRISLLTELKGGKIKLSQELFFSHLQVCAPGAPVAGISQIQAMNEFYDPGIVDFGPRSRRHYLIRKFMQSIHFQTKGGSRHQGDD